MASPWAKYANSVSSSVSRPRPIRNETIEIPLPSNYMSMSSSMSPPLANQPFLPPMSVPGVIGTQEQPPPYTELSFEDEDSAIENADLDDVDDDPKPTEPKENTPLVSPPELSSRRKKTASTFGSIINLCNTITASGALALPYAMAQMGIYLGSILSIVFAFAALFGLILLVECAKLLHRRWRHSVVHSSDSKMSSPPVPSFFTVSSAVGPRTAVFVNLAIGINCFGITVGFLVILGRLLPDMVRTVDPFLPMPLTETSAMEWAYDRTTWITIIVVFLTPLCFLRQFDSLKFVSVVGMSAMCYIIGMVAYFYLTDSKIFVALPLLMLSFACHENVKLYTVCMLTLQIFTIYNELGQQACTTHGVSVISILLSTAAYALVSICGYLTWGPSADANIVNNYPISNNAPVAFARFCNCLIMICAYPVLFHPCRAAWDNVLFAYDDPNHWRHARFFILTVVLLAATYFVAVSVQSLETVLAVVGAAGSTTKKLFRRICTAFCDLFVLHWSNINVNMPNLRYR